LIALSRAIFEFFKNTQGGEPERLHEYEERKAARSQFLQSFSPGVISSELLRDALGLNLDDENQIGRLPWLWNILDWGYPPGWFSEGDPTLLVMALVEGEDIWTDSADASQVFDNPVYVDTEKAPYECMNVIRDNELVGTLSDTENPPGRKRWAHYQTDLFSSDHLTVHSGQRLSPFSILGRGRACHRGAVQMPSVLLGQRDGVNYVFEKNSGKIRAETDDSDMELSNRLVMLDFK